VENRGKVSPLRVKGVDQVGQEGGVVFNKQSRIRGTENRGGEQGKII